MKVRILVCAVLIAFVSTLSTNVWGEKSKQLQKKVNNQTTDYVVEEIDNFDFLYTDSDSADYNIEGLQLVNNILDEAYSHIGTRYRYGSKGPNTFDCSGFTSYVFKQYDMAIGCSSRDQYAKNTPVKRNDMQRGDLVFFTSPHSGKGVGHVGIIVDVNPDNTFTFIHASTKEGVKVSNSTDGYYTRRFIGIRRAL